MKELTRIDGSMIEQYFREDIHPESFLERLHDVMVRHISTASRRNGEACVDELAEDIEFLESIHRSVRNALRKPEQS